MDIELIKSIAFVVTAVACLFNFSVILAALFGEKLNVGFVSNTYIAYISLGYQIYFWANHWKLITY